MPIRRKLVLRWISSDLMLTPFASTIGCAAASPPNSAAASPPPSSLHSLSSSAMPSQYCQQQTDTCSACRAPAKPHTITYKQCATRRRDSVSNPTDAQNARAASLNSYTPSSMRLAPCCFAHSRAA